MATSKSRTREPATSDDVFDFAPGWMPLENESLIGAVTERSVGEGEYGEYIIITLRPDAGQSIHVKEGDSRMPVTTTGDEDDLIAVHCFGAVLDNAVRKMRPAVGARLAFKSLGKRLRKGGDENRKQDWFNAWAVRDLSVKSDDDIFGKPEPSAAERGKRAAEAGGFGDEPPF
jgi:hypothetical protein